MSHRFLFWITFVAMLIGDQLVKMWARNAADWVEGRTFWPLWPGVFEFTLTYNHGVAFGLLQGYGYLMAPVAILIAGGAAVYSWRKPEEPTGIHLGLALIATGAIGNLIDRVWKQKVTDMFHLSGINFPVFNIADVCITVGAGLLVLLWGLEGLRQGKHAEHAQNEPAPTEP